MRINFNFLISPLEQFEISSYNTLIVDISTTKYLNIIEQNYFYTYDPFKLFS